MTNREVDHPIFFPLPKSSPSYMYSQQSGCQSYMTVSQNYPTTSANARRCAIYCSDIDSELEQLLDKFAHKQPLPGSSSDTESVLQIDDLRLQNGIPSRQEDCKILQNSPKPSTSKVDVPVFYHSKEASECQIFRPTREKLVNMKETVLEIDNLNLKKDSSNKMHRKTFDYSSIPSTSKGCVPDAIRFKNEYRMSALFPSNMMELEPHEKSSDTKAVLQINDPDLQGDLPSPQQDCKKLQNAYKPSTSKLDVPAIHYSKKTSDCQIFLPTEEKLAPPRNSHKKQTVLQADNPELQKDSLRKQNLRTFGYSSKPSTSKDYVVSFKKEPETCSLLQTNTEELAPEENSCRIETTVSSPIAETAVEDVRSDEPEDSESSQKVEYSRKQWTVIILAWLTTAVGLGIYVYLLSFAFSGNTDIFKDGPIFTVVCLISAICLLSAVYFNYKIKKYFL